MRAPSDIAPALTDVRTITLCVLASICVGFDFQAAGVAAAGIAPEFEPNPVQFGYFFSASTFGLFIGAVLGGRLSDRLGRRTVLIASIAVFGLFSLLTAAAWDITSLTGARFLTGVGLGGALPNVIALVSESSGPHRRSANVTLAYAGMPLGGALVSLLSWWAAAEQWRWIFIAGGVAPLIVAPLMAVALRESPAFEQLRLAKPHAAQMPRAGSFMALLQEGRALPTLLLWTTFFLALLTLFLLLNWLPTLLLGNGFTKTQAAAAQVLFNVGGALGALLAGQLMEGNLRRPCIVVVSVAVPLLIAWLANAPASLGTLNGVVILLGGGLVGSQAILYALSPACYPTSIRGVGVGSAVAVGRTGSAVGPLLAASLLSAGQTSSQVLMALLPITIASGIGCIVLAQLVPRKAVE
jgi:AAHS family 3-hydroxyphenylpropionic acid transporter